MTDDEIIAAIIRRFLGELHALGYSTHELARVLLH